jgi:aspartate/methionine/tyrosine aminotransferase
MAGVAALTGSQRPSVEMVAEFRRRRDTIVAGLNAIPGINCLTPHGAFYVFPNITGTAMTSREVADRLLYEGGVAALAGTAFGAYGEGYIRLSYANSISNIELALQRIKTTLAIRKRAHPNRPKVASKAGKAKRAIDVAKPAELRQIKKPEPVG